MTPFVIVDVETSGLDPETDELLEVGAVLYSADEGAVVDVRSMLVHASANGAEAVNRIPASLLRLGTPRDEAVARLGDMINRGPQPGTYMLAHNAAFDRAWLPEFAGERWVCTKEDADWPLADRECPSLVKLALSYEVGVVRAHRAIEDCLTLAAVLSKVHALEGGLEGWLARALEPRREVCALVGYGDRQLAKDAGFTWDPDRRRWVKKVRESQMEAFAEGLPFLVRAGEAR